MRPPLRALAVLLLLPALGRAQTGPCSPSAAAAHPAYSPVQLRRIGQQALAAVVARYGRATSATDRKDVAAVLSKLVAATGDPHADIQWELVGDPDLNATALPGRILVVNQGLVTKFRQLAAEEGGTPAGRKARFDGYAAAVIGHELAHITLGHSDSMANDALRCAASRLTDGGRVRADTLNAEGEAALAEVLANAGALRETARIRVNETAADRVGALYMLRAGWQIQQAIDLFAYFDALERSSGEARLSSLTWLLDHPRSSQRAADLEVFRARLKMHQAEFDDALVLVRNGVMLDSAVTMLDRVLADLPGLAPVRHARAAALQGMWMESAPPRARAVQTSVPTHDANFAAAIRGAGVGDQALLAAARAEYRRVLSREVLPYALSNLAVLDAYAGDARTARARADSAIRLRPSDVEVANNRAAVLYLIGDPAGARREWERLTRTSDADPLRFNLARSALALGDSATARRLLVAYAQGDSSSWGREARRLVALISPSAGRRP
jgi:Putative Zn-dependent protease, contains TPR repeats